MTALHIAVCNGWSKLIPLLASPANVNLLTNSNRTALHFAKTPEDTNSLLGVGADPNIVSDMGLTPMLEFCMNGDVDSALTIVHHGIRFNSVNWFQQDLSGKNFLHICAHMNYLTIVRSFCLVMERRDRKTLARVLDQFTRKHHTVLHAACHASNYSMTQLLLAAGASPILKNASGHTAAEISKNEIVRHEVEGS